MIYQNINGGAKPNIYFHHFIPRHVALPYQLEIKYADFALVALRHKSYTVIIWTIVVLYVLTMRCKNDKVITVDLCKSTR